MGDILIVGSGVAGHRAAAEISRLAPNRQVDVIGAEPGLPYDRPPLSKDYLLAELPKRPTLAGGDIYGGRVRLHEGLVAEHLSRGAHQVSLSDGSSMDYEVLLLATGSRLRRLPLPELDHGRVHYLRTVEDARRLRAALVQGARVCIIGGGFIGLEVAAAAVQRGCAVTLLEMAPRLLSRAATPALACFVKQLHAGHGLEIMLGTAVRAAAERDGGAVLAWDGGETIADVVVVGVGVIPNIELASESGLAIDDGIVVDAACHTSDAAIFAAGEVTNYPIGNLGVRMRTESWSAASSQAVVAARQMLGADSTFGELPWFWSDQYDVNIQCVGLPKSATEYLQIGEPTSRKWMRIGVDHADRLVGAEAVNMGREMSALRRADRSGQPVPHALLALANSREPAAHAEPTLIASTR